MCLCMCVSVCCETVVCSRLPVSGVHHCSSPSLLYHLPLPSPLSLFRLLSLPSLAFLFLSLLSRLCHCLPACAWTDLRLGLARVRPALSVSPRASSARSSCDRSAAKSEAAPLKAPLTAHASCLESISSFQCFPRKKGPTSEKEQKTTYLYLFACIR